jgi:hypothetical protein
MDFKRIIIHISSYPIQIFITGLYCFILKLYSILKKNFIKKPQLQQRVTAIISIDRNTKTLNN